MTLFEKACEVLKLKPEEATRASVKKSWRELALQYHPDKNPGKDTSQQMKELNEAYDFLDAELKSELTSEFLERLNSLGHYTLITDRYCPNSPSYYEEKAIIDYSNHALQIKEMVKMGYVTFERLEALSDDTLRFIARHSELFLKYSKDQVELIIDDDQVLNAFVTQKLVLDNFPAHRIYEKFRDVLTIFKALDNSFFIASKIQNIDGFVSCSETQRMFRTQIRECYFKNYVSDAGIIYSMRVLFDPVIENLFLLRERQLALIASQSCLDAINSEIYQLSELIEFNDDDLELLVDSNCTEAIADNILDKSCLFKAIENFHIASSYSSPPELLKQVTSPTYLDSLRCLKEKQGDKYDAKLAVGYACNRLRTLNVFGYTTNDHSISNLEIAVRNLPLSPSKAAASSASHVLSRVMFSAKEEFINADDPVEAELIFVRTCLEAIEEARPALEKYHHIRIILLDIANAILSLVTLGIVPLVTGRFRFFEETRGKAALFSLSDIQDRLETLLPEVSTNTERAASSSSLS